MKTDFFNGMFGKIEPGKVRLDVNGNIAVSTQNGYKSYNMKTGNLINCNNFVFDIGEEFFFVIPTNKVVPGDIILAQGGRGGRTPKCVTAVNKNAITVINYEDSTIEQILPERHMFMGSTYFYGKIVSLFNFGKGKKNSNGFGNILKFKMMSDMMGGFSGNKIGTDNTNPMGNMLMLSMMSNGGFSDIFNFDSMFDFDNNEDEEDIQEEDE